MTALSTAEAALRRVAHDPGELTTVTGTEAAALTAELDRLRAVERAAREVVAHAEPVDPHDPDSELVLWSSHMKDLVGAVRLDEPGGAAS